MIPPNVRFAAEHLPQNYRFLKIPLTILDWPLSPAAFRCWVAIFRLTYGYKKISDVLALAQIIAATQIPERSLRRAIKDLEKLGLLKVSRKTKAASQYEPLFPRYNK